jgi:hypothetical protein
MCRRFDVLPHWIFACEIVIRQIEVRRSRDSSRDSSCHGSSLDCCTIRLIDHSAPLITSLTPACTGNVCPRTRTGIAHLIQHSGLVQFPFILILAASAN